MNSAPDPRTLAIVSSADSKYFPLLRELIASLRVHSQAAMADICIIDAGMTEAEIATLRDSEIQVQSVEWPCAISAKKIGNRTFLKACVSRPFIPRIFPGYATYLWIDCDCWVQDWAAIDLLVRGAAKSGLAIVPQTDRAYGKTMRLGWLGPFPFRPRSFYYSNAKKAFGGRIARRLFPFPTINAGVFAIRADAPHWERWQALICQALKMGKVFTAEQLTLGMLIYLETFPAELLPAWCNWLCETRPVFDAAQNRFVEPYLPRHPIGILHLSGCDDMRLDRNLTYDLQTVTGTTVSRSLRYPGKA